MKQYYPQPKFISHLERMKIHFPLFSMKQELLWPKEGVILTRIKKCKKACAKINESGSLQKTYGINGSFAKI